MKNEKQKIENFQTSLWTDFIRSFIHFLQFFQLSIITFNFLFGESKKKTINFQTNFTAAGQLWQLVGYQGPKKTKKNSNNN